jgi:hypothetical protein
MEQGEESSVRIERLQAAASELETLDEESEIYDRAVAIADDLFSFHAAVMLTDEDGELIPPGRRRAGNPRRRVVSGDRRGHRREDVRNRRDPPRA